MHYNAKALALHVTALQALSPKHSQSVQTPSIITLSPPPSHHTSPSKYPHFTSAIMSADPEREHALDGYKTKLLESREWEAKLKALRLEIKGLQHDFDVSEDNIKALQSVGQIIGEVLKQLDEERCASPLSTFTKRTQLIHV
jgi:hypothetical protein